MHFGHRKRCAMLRWFIGRSRMASWREKTLPKEKPDDLAGLGRCVTTAETSTGNLWRCWHVVCCVWVLQFITSRILFYQRNVQTLNQILKNGFTDPPYTHMLSTSIWQHNGKECWCRDAPRVTNSKPTRKWIARRHGVQINKWLEFLHNIR